MLMGDWLRKIYREIQSIRKTVETIRTTQRAVTKGLVDNSVIGEKQEKEKIIYISMVEYGAYYDRDIQVTYAGNCKEKALKSAKAKNGAGWVELWKGGKHIDDIENDVL